MEKNIDHCYIGQEIKKIDYDEDYGTLILSNGEKLYSMDVEKANIYIGAVIEEIIFVEEIAHIILDNEEKLEVMLSHENVNTIEYPGLAINLNTILNRMTSRHPRISTKNLAKNFKEVDDAFNQLIGKWFRFVNIECMVLAIEDYDNLKVRVLLDNETKIIQITSLR